MTDCTYCGCEVEAHDPVAVYETAGSSDELAGEFCNWGCLAAYATESDVASGTSCNWTPEA
jgi:hypothetical protein